MANNRRHERQWKHQMNPAEFAASTDETASPISACTQLNAYEKSTSKLVASTASVTEPEPKAEKNAATTSHQT